jgi:diaminopimelate decarboxylase
MDLVSSLIERHFSRAGDELVVGKLLASELAARFGTPLFIYDQGILAKRWLQLHDLLPADFDIAYSVKANPNQAILRFFLGMGARLEIASGGEFCQVTAAGCAPGNIIFAGPGKTPQELELVLSKGIGELHAESLREVERIETIASKMGTRARVAIRVNPSGEAEGGAMRMGGRAAAFGVDEESMAPVLERLLSSHHIDFRGIHLFAGTQILDANVLLSQYAKGLEIARHIFAKTGAPLHTVDFGGGLGIPYFSNDAELDREKLRGGLGELWKGVKSDKAFAGTRFLVEPGRYLVGEAGLYLTRVIDVKMSRGKQFVILDGGMNQHLAASGNLGQTIKRNYPIAVVNKLGRPAVREAELAGPLCTPLDVVGRSVQVPELEPDDLVAIFQSGAYGRSASPLGFLSHASPAEVLVDGESAALIRRRGEWADYLQDQPSEAM